MGQEAAQHSRSKQPWKGPGMPMGTGTGRRVMRAETESVCLTHPAGHLGHSRFPLLSEWPLSPGGHQAGSRGLFQTRRDLLRGSNKAWQGLGGLQCRDSAEGNPEDWGGGPTEGCQGLLRSLDVTRSW